MEAAAARRGPPEVDLSLLLDRLVAWVPLDVDAMLDDAAEALDDVPPSAELVPDLLERLLLHLDQLGNIAIAAGANQRMKSVADLVDHSATLRALPLPEHPAHAHGHLRRIGWTVSELMDELVESKCLKGTA
ncbi:DUF6415 family natural product biosynthesis protein [Streptomyces sp. NPDC058067]|uniref:DUF6415 family natural product biosynthesis protein n=1 Tax=Streptomyces sp. NPDC058067 TaxID=3346324 RepID=UPI0036EC6CF8